MEGSSSRPVRILFVCMGNICRSPLAEGVFRSLVAKAGHSEQFEIVSAGTGSWHVGQAPDSRMQAVALKYGISLADQHARQFVQSDLEEFEHIFAMDRDNLHDILYFDQNNEYGNKVRLFRELDPTPDDYQVPDPYYGGDGGFDRVFQIVERTATEILRTLESEYNLNSSS